MGDVCEESTWTCFKSRGFYRFGKEIAYHFNGSFENGSNHQRENTEEKEQLRQRKEEYQHVRAKRRRNLEGG